jgi:hypothetical protein
MEFVHPSVYALRAACPLWTNTPNAEHRHRVACAGYNETDVASEYGRLLAERDRLIGIGVDPADLDIPMQP